MDFLVGEGIIDGDCHSFGNLAQQTQVGGGKCFLFALCQFQHAQHGIARHQRQQAQRLDLVAPGIEQHAFVGG